MPLITLPSVILDAVFEDNLDATHAVCTGTVAGSYNLGVGGTFTIAVDGGAAQTIVFADALFSDILAATATEVAAAINTQLTDAVATVVLNRIVVTSSSYGATSQLTITNGTLAIVTLLGFGPGVTVTQNGVDATPAIILTNRNPAPGESAIPAAALIYFEFAATTGVAPLPADMIIEIESVVAWNGTSWVNGFSGTISTPFADVLAVELTALALFTSAQIVDVRVVLTTPAFDETYYFVAGDTAPPLIYDVQGRSETVLRVTFTEPVKMVLPADSDDALNPANYIIERLSRPAVSVNVISVNVYDTYTVDLTTDIELTFGAPYLLMVSNVVDLEDNAFLPPNNAFMFNAFAPAFPKGRRFRLFEMLPEINRREDANQDLEVFVGIFQEITNLLLSLVDRWSDIIDLDLAGEGFLDAMLVDLGNPFSEFDLTTIDKRRLLRVLVSMYKLKGTPIGIVDVVRFFLGIEITIEIFNGFDAWELTDAGADPTVGNELGDDFTDAFDPAYFGPGPDGLYSFIVDSPYALLTVEQRSRIASIAELMKPAHTHLVAITDPTPEIPIDHVELGLSMLGSGIPGESSGTFVLHA